MAGPNELVLGRVREELSRRPDLPPGVLYQMAKGIDPQIGQQTLQQFHIRYVLPVLQEQTPVPRKQRRRRSDAKRPPRQPRRPRSAAIAQPEEPPRREPPTPPQAAPPQAEQSPPEQRQPRQRRRSRAEHQAAAAGERKRIRAILLRFALGLASAESASEIVEVIRGVSALVDEVFTQQG